MSTSNKIYDFLKAKYLINDNAFENWKFILFVLVLAMVMITNIHSYEAKIFKIADLSTEVKELRSEFVDRKSELMKLKMESTITQKMKERGIVPSEVPPVKVKVIIEKEPNWWERLWK
jgi:ribosomal protein L31E